MKATLTEAMKPGFTAADLEDGTAIRIIVPQLGLNLARPPQLAAGTVVEVIYDGHEDAYWVVGHATNSRRAFQTAEPFPHVVIDNFLPADRLLNAAADFDRVPAEAWHRYDGPDERGKRACNRWQDIPATSFGILSWLTGAGTAERLEMLTGIDGLKFDPTLYGGGLHVTEPGGFLGVHLDNERHPATGLVRRLNLIVYCTPEWQAEWGGELELWDRGLTRPVVSIVPQFGRAVIFETGPHSYHGHTRPVVGPVARKSLATYYWTEPRARARFVRTAVEEFDAKREEARRQRSRNHSDSGLADPAIITAIHAATVHPAADHQNIG